MIARILRSFVLGVALAGGAVVAVAPTVAYAQDDEGIDVKVVVLDEAGAPIPTAVVRHPQEADRHRVNTIDGSWTGSVLYLPDGSELKFTKGMIVEFEISAPGYVNQRVQYQVRKRKNVVTVQLAKMALDLGAEEEDDPVIQFGRDKPIDGASSDPAQ